MIHLKSLRFIGVFLAVMTAVSLVPQTVQADSTNANLFTATSDAFSGSLALGLSLDVDSTITGIHYEFQGKAQTLPLENLSAGVVLYRAQGHDVAILSSSNFDPKHGGTIHLEYLRSAISGVYGTFDAELYRQGSAWIISVNDTAGHRAFTTMYLKAKKFFGVVIGVDRINVQ